MKSPITFKVAKDGIVLTLDPEANFNRIKEALRDHVNSATNFYAGADLYINIAESSFKIDQLNEIVNIARGYKDVKNIIFTSDVVKRDTVEVNNEGETYLINRTLRSGQKIKKSGNVVIIGDINPGAEVIAGGNIIVFGKIRGVVHAGASGSTEASVTALKLEPTQLRISKKIARPPEESSNKKSLKPERAFIQDGQIMVEDFEI
ncbi:MAG TPA: septum site-determining protein MinC [Halanaerobiales bacterium]|nr:septum site-determining protein MinC [Halanaerobiales bacterium]